MLQFIPGFRIGATGSEVFDATIAEAKQPATLLGLLLGSCEILGDVKEAG